MLDGRYQPQLGIEDWDEEEGEGGGGARGVDQQREQCLQGAGDGEGGVVHVEGDEAQSE